MLRDFSDEKKEELIEAIDSAETSDFWSGTWDWFTDCFISDKISDYRDDIMEYHRKIVDKKNTTVQQLNTIFDEVHDVDTRYANMFASLKNRLIDLIAAVDAAAEVLNPAPAGGGGYALLGPRSEMLAKLAPIGEVAQSEAYYAMLRQSKGTGEMYLHSSGIIYEGEVYPFTVFTEAPVQEGTFFSNDPGWRVVATKENNEITLDGWVWFLTAAGVGTPGTPEPDLRVYGGNVLLHKGPETRRDRLIANGLDLGASVISGFCAALDNHSVRITLRMNKAGEKQAVIDISSHKYRDYVAGKVNFIQAPESAVSTLPDGSKVDVRMTYDYPMRHEDTYFGTLGLDAEGNWVMRQKCFPGDKVLATVPVVTPHGVGSTEVDITRYYYQTLFPINPKYIELLQQLGQLG